MPTKAVGLLLFTVIDGILYAVCQVRGAFNFQTMRSESWAGLLQPTCHGKLREDEEYIDALRRKVGEELGANGPLSDIDPQHLTPLQLQRVRTYGCMVKPWVIREVTLHPSTGGLRLISRQGADAIRFSQSGDRDGVPPGQLVMFEDDFGAMLMGFSHFGK